MSGGFFRGTSADQDTRFSNKQAKLLKSQKFAPELENLVDITKVQMDVMRPWIATRVTELIGFEDEVLINFIYGLLDGKEVNGKEIQISLTGFMERNTGKFMKEMWSLLLSAQKNASGVPQQFLDAKEEETEKKKAESDRIANEIRRKKENESQELEQERTKKMDRGNDILKDVDTGVQPSSKHQPRARSAEEKESEERNGLQGRSRISKSPHSAYRSSSPRESRSRSISKSFSNSRSNSGERRRSRSISASPRQRGRSSSSEMVHRSSHRRSLSHRRHPSRRSFTPRRISSYSRRRSSSRSRHWSPSPTRYRRRSPLHRKTHSPHQRRSRSPIWRRPRSPTRRSSPRDRCWSPLRHQSSSVRHISPSPIRRNSSSPARSQSPIRRGSPSPIRHVLPSPIRRKSPIMGRRSPTPVNDKSPSPQASSSPSQHRRYPSPIRRKSPRMQRRSPLQSPRGRIRSREKSSPVHHAAPRNTVEHPTSVSQRLNSSEHRSRSDPWEQNDSHRQGKRSSPSPRHSPSVSEADEKEMSLIEKRREKLPRSYSPYPPRKARENKHHGDSSEMSAEDKKTDYVGDSAKRKHDSSTKIPSSNQQKDLQGKGNSEDHLSPERSHGHHPVQKHSQPDKELNKRDQMLQRENKSERIGHQKKPGQQEPQMIRDIFHIEKGKESSVGERHRAVEKNQSYANDMKINDQHLDAAPKLSRKVEHNDQSASLGSDSEESDKSRDKVKNKRKKKRAERRGSVLADESSYDSYAEERKEAKRRRKEEKRLKKEDRRQRRREERRRRKEQRHAEKQKLKSKDAVSSPSDTRNRDIHSDDDQSVKKKLEIELRERALESLRAKKGISH